jgi:plastocyanin
MTRRHLALGAAVLAAGLALAGCGGKKSSVGTQATTTPPTTTASGGSAGGGTLAGKVGPGFDISLTQNGKPVTTLAPGTYVLNVDDQADIHDFHLTGPGVDVSTDVAFKGTKSFTIKLVQGSYHYQCDPHSSSMNGDFTVG